MNIERSAENFNIFDFELTAEETAAIDALDKGESGRVGPNPDIFAWVPTGQCPARSAADALAGAGHKVLAVRCDVTDEADAAEMVEKSVFTFARLDAAFNNAGLHVPVANTADAEAADFD